MSEFKNRVGERYGRLLVTSHAGKDARNKHLWLCKCDCGNEKVVVSDNLSIGIEMDDIYFNIANNRIKQLIIKLIIIIYDNNNC